MRLKRHILVFETALRKNPERKNLEFQKRENPERNYLECKNPENDKIYNAQKSRMVLYLMGSLMLLLNTIKM